MAFLRDPVDILLVIVVEEAHGRPVDAGRKSPLCRTVGVHREQSELEII